MHVYVYWLPPIRSYGSVCRYTVMLWSSRIHNNTALNSAPVSLWHGELDRFRVLGLTMTWLPAKWFISTSVADKWTLLFQILVIFCLGVDGWMNLTEIDPDEEVQGEIHLQISVLGDADIPRKLCCQVLEARWGPARNGKWLVTETYLFVSVHL